MRGVLYRTEKDGTTLAVPELRISASNSRTVYYENNAAKQSALNNNEIREGSIVLTGLAGNNEDYATKAYVDSKIGNLEHQVGVIVGFPGNVPNGYLLCDGNRFDKNKYPELYEYLGTDVLPDYRECVLVGAGQNTTNSIATHDVYTVGQFKDDQIQKITGQFYCSVPINHAGYASGVFTGSGGDKQGQVAFDGTTRDTYGYSLDSSKVARAGTVTHGKQKGLNWAIKAAPITISSSPIQYQEGDLLKLKQQPDWEHAETSVSIPSNGYTVPSNGIIICIIKPNSSQTIRYYVNGVQVVFSSMYGSTLRFVVPVGEGDLITTEGSGTKDVQFVPFKTVAVKLSSSTSTESISLEDSYSTTETKTNKIWIDGRTIYRQCITVNTTSSYASATEATINASTTYPYINQIISATQIDSANKRIINPNGVRMVNNTIRVYAGAYGIDVGHTLILEYVK